MAQTRSKHAADSGTARAAHPTCAHFKAIQSGLATYAICPQPLTCARAALSARRLRDAQTPSTANLRALSQRLSASRRTNAAIANLRALHSAPVGSATHKRPPPHAALAAPGDGRFIMPSGQPRIAPQPFSITVSISYGLNSSVTLPSTTGTSRSTFSIRSVRYARLAGTPSLSVA